MCFSGGQETTVRIVINSVDDPPKLVDPDDQDVYFPPVPYNLSSLPEEGISIAALTKNNNKLLRLLTSFSRGEEALQILSQGGTLLTLIEKVDVPSYVREVLDQPLMYDESPEVGIAIVFNRWPEFGKWVYNIDGSWKDVDVNNTVDALKSGRDIEALFLSPKARLKFLPKDESTFWTQGQADIKSFLIIFGWDGSDNSTSGKRVVNTSDVANTITRDPLFLVVDRLGCDKRPGSMATSDECGECRGRGRCIGCDGKANSGAKYGKCWLTLLQSAVLFSPRSRTSLQPTRSLAIAITKANGKLSSNQYREGAWDRMEEQDSSGNKGKCRITTIVEYLPAETVTMRYFCLPYLSKRPQVQFTLPLGLPITHVLCWWPAQA